MGQMVFGWRFIRKKGGDEVILYVPADISTEDIIKLQKRGYSLIYDFDKEGLYGWL